MACSKKHKAYILKYKALILKYVPYIFDVYKCLKQNGVKIPVFAAFPTLVLTSFGRGFLYKPEKPGTRLNLYLTCV